MLAPTRRLFPILASGLALGYLPWFPGTWGSLWGVLIYLGLYRLPMFPYLATLLGFIFFAAWIANEAEWLGQKKDPSWIVIDEVVGLLTALTFLPISWEWMLAAFVLFRIFDIWKPYPCRLIQERVPGGWGIVGDDVVAGIYANLILQVAVRMLWG